ncbi:MAG: hypothetical protein KAT43_05060 [Nanoarchaeota archaeon]|nr:hypothetical protein [Nanoarchaeota archaeon]
MEEILDIAQKLYSGDVNTEYTIEMLARDTGVDINIIKGLDEGIDMFIDPTIRKDPKEIVEYLKRKYNIDQKITYRILLDLTERGLKAYRAYRTRKICSRRIAGNSVGLDGFTFEYFFWARRMSTRESQTRLPCEIKLEKLIQDMKDLAA